MVILALILMVEGVAMITRHTRAVGNVPGGRIVREGTINASNVMLVCPHCKAATRVNNKRNAEGKKIRVCKKCGKDID